MFVGPKKNQASAVEMEPGDEKPTPVDDIRGESMKHESESVPERDVIPTKQMRLRERKALVRDFGKLLRKSYDNKI